MMISRNLTPKIMAVISAGVVLGTFVVKDVEGEKYRNTSSDIDSTISNLVAQADATAASIQLAYMQLQIDKILAGQQNQSLIERTQLKLQIDTATGQSHPVNTQSAPQKVPSEARDMLEAYKGELEAELSYGSNIARPFIVAQVIDGNLIGHFPREHQDAEKWSQFTVQTKLLEAAVSAEGKKLSPIFTALEKDTDDKEAWSNLAKYKQTMASLTHKIAIEDGKSGDFGGVVRSNLDALKRTAEQRYERAMWVTYLLFTVGWLIGLRAQLAHPDSNS